MKAALVLYGFLATGIIAIVTGALGLVQKYSVNLADVTGMVNSLNPSSFIDSIDISTLGSLGNPTVLGAIVLLLLLLAYSSGFLIFHLISKRRS